MSGTRILKAASIALLAAAMSFGVAACGSDDGDSGQSASPQASGSNSSGQVTPEKKAPESAGDKKKNAPDDVISDKPGGSSQPVQP